MRELAARYGVSDVALAKAYKRLLIPLSGRGYGAKKAVNVPTSARPPLPEVGVVQCLSSPMAHFKPGTPRAVGVLCCGIVARVFSLRDLKCKYVNVTQSRLTAA